MREVDASNWCLDELREITSSFVSGVIERLPRARERCHQIRRPRWRVPGYFVACEYGVKVSAMDLHTRADHRRRSLRRLCYDTRPPEVSAGASAELCSHSYSTIGVRRMKECIGGT